MYKIVVAVSDAAAAADVTDVSFNALWLFSMFHFAKYCNKLG